MVLALRIVESQAGTKALMAETAGNKNANRRTVMEILLLMLFFKWHPKLLKASKQNQVRLIQNIISIFYFFNNSGLKSLYIRVMITYRNRICPTWLGYGP